MFANSVRATLVVFLVVLSTGSSADEVVYSSCEGGDASLSGEAGIIYCEPFETVDFWIGKGYLSGSGSREKVPADSTRFENISSESLNCVSGDCIRIHIPHEECCGISVSWPLDEAGIEPTNVYLRYYLKLASNFDPALCRGGSSSGDGGKFPGLADPRSFPEEQCGNGGNPSDGLNCWTARSLFKSCAFACESVPNASTRFGTYAYHARQDGFWGDHAVWDADVNRQTGPTCNVSHSQSENCPVDQIISCSSGPDVVGTCGIGGSGNLINNRWYAVELQVGMNDPGQPNGILRGWIDGNMAYEKTNMIWRLEGHDNLHVRTVWLNVHFGGELVGPCDPSGTDVYMDQMVVATTPIGVIGEFQQRVTPQPPANLSTD